MWLLISRVTPTGFIAEIPPGEYYVGNPDVMVLPGILETTQSLDNGVFESMDDESIFAVYTYPTSHFTVYSGGYYTRLFSEKGRIAIMSADIAKPLPSMNRFRINCDYRGYIELDGVVLSLFCQHVIVHVAPDSGRDEDIYDDASNAIGN
jgi:hypothetical protein